MEPIPTSFHVGPLVFHTYGLGLAVTAYVAYWYAARRISRHGLSTAHFGRFTGWVLVAALVGARAAHVATNWTLYSHDLMGTLAVWHGGLSSFGGIALAAPVGWILARRWWPGVTLEFTDALVPALVAAWALGRLLGPQLMVAGGGHVTHQWFGMRYAGQAGKRVPVPIIQALEDGTLWLVLLGIERRWRGRLVLGVSTGVACVVWGLVRSLDEHLLLGQESHSGSVGVQIAGLVLAVIGVLVLIGSWRRTRTREPVPAAPS